MGETSTWRARLRQWLGAWFAALQFLTTIPPIVRRPFELVELGRATAFYPLVGLLCGGLLAGLYAVLLRIWPAPVAAALVLAGEVLATGALHLDGFLDSCDGLFGGHTVEARLRILRDHNVGAYALAGGVVLLLLKFVCLLSLAGRWQALPLAWSLGRWGITLAVVSTPYARPEGLGRAIKDTAAWREALIATVFAAAGAWWLGGLWGAAALALAAVVVWLVSRLALARLPGLTGDLYGAVCELVELAVLLLYSGHWLQ